MFHTIGPATLTYLASANILDDVNISTFDLLKYFMLSTWMSVVKIQERSARRNVRKSPMWILWRRQRSSLVRNTILSKTTTAHKSYYCSKIDLPFLIYFIYVYFCISIFLYIYLYICMWCWFWGVGRKSLWQSKIRYFVRKKSRHHFITSGDVFCHLLSFPQTPK